MSAGSRTIAQANVHMRGSYLFLVIYVRRVQLVASEGVDETFSREALGTIGVNHGHWKTAEIYNISTLYFAFLVHLSRDVKLLNLAMELSSLSRPLGP